LRLAFSSIAWDPTEDEAVAGLLREAGVEAVELAPTKLWADLASVPPTEASAVRSAWAGRGLPVVALQSLLYGRPDLRLFGTPSQRADLCVYLEGVLELAARLGASVLVFGSPRNRQRGRFSAEEATAIAAEFFATMAERANALGLVLCLEPNPPEYGCDFVTSARAGLELVATVGHPGFRLHLDAACMTLAHDPVAEAIGCAAGAGFLCHFHMSEPDLRPVGGPPSDVQHEAFASELRASGYGRFVSVEMRPPDPAGRHQAIAAAAAFAVRTYQRGD
jgi:D-psicose/D-tagatose/L-ribulose 3-epimerase